MKNDDQRAERLCVPKTYKLFIGGAFVRSESGKSMRQEDSVGQLVGNCALASRKDLRDAVGAARKAQQPWASRSAFNRSQILFRVAEVLESRRSVFETALVSLMSNSVDEAHSEVDEAIDRMFWYAGWTDKFSQVLGGVNPVATPFFNFSLPEPTGVVAVLAPRNAALLGIVSSMAPVILSGNACVMLVDNQAPTIAIDFAEVLATSDVPAGVVNVLTGTRDQLVSHAAEHMDINAIACFGDQGRWEDIQVGSAANLKRAAFFEDPPLADWLGNETRSLYWIERFIEWKTAWHPIGK